MSKIDKVLSERYVLKELIGQGGMADVYLGEDTILKRTVAIKVMRSSLTGDPIYVTRFHREASAAASLSHKNIVEIYDVGQDGDDYYIVMEYVPGQTLKELIHKRGALHYVEAIDIMKQICLAVAKAHSMGIVHRDLKPHNIMIMDSGYVKIMDFGIASIQSLSQVTQTDTIMGSLHYLAPEIARGEKASPQSDIYALGIVLYELLRGDVPFNGESPVNIALKHMRDEIPSVCHFNSSIPQSLENVIIKATAKNVKDRYLKADDMFDDLSTCTQRLDEKKLVFVHDDSSSSTIIASEKDFFTHTQTNKFSVEEDNGTKKKKNLIYIILAIASSLLLFGFIYFLVLKPADNFPMPNLIGMDYQQAVTLLEEKGLIIDEFVNSELSEQYDEGVIVASTPYSDAAVKKGDTVFLTVSSGKYIIINDYVGKIYEEIKDEINSVGFKVEIVEVVSDEEKGVILQQSLEYKAKIAPDDIANKKMVLTVSKGYEQVVPNVYGTNINTAKDILTEAGFLVEIYTLEPPQTKEEIKTMKIDVVMTQSIDAFTVITKKNTKIILGYYDRIPELPDDNIPDNQPNGDDNPNGNNQPNGDNNSGDTQTGDTTNQG